MERSLWRRPGPLPPLTGRQWAVDAVVAAVVALIQALGGGFITQAHGHPLSAAGLALPAASGAVLAARRRYPVTVLAATYVLVFAYLATQRQGAAPWLASTIAFCTAIYLRRRAAAIGFLVACYVASQWGPMLAGSPAPKPSTDLTVGAGLVFLLGVAELIRLRGQRSLALRQRSEEEALRRASEERLRIARDLHDVVAHNISVINVQASTALHLMDRQPERARSALTTISEVSKQALVEVRSVLGVLRDIDEQAPRAPSVSLAAVGDLIANARAAGVGVELAETGERRVLPAAVDAAGYRILQEALTNCARHSPGTTVAVRVRYGERELVIEVDDDGPDGRIGAGRPGHGGAARATSGGEGSGNGIVGMTERAHALAGTLEAGPRPGGGFWVWPPLPLDADPAGWDRGPREVAASNGATPPNGATP
jgi:signal transduction histidine kinase